MGNLTARGPVDFGTLTVGGASLSVAPPGSIWAIAPYGGRVDALSDALKAVHGVTFPSPGTCETAGNVRLVWSGIDQAFLFGMPPDNSLAAHGALTDQSDAWTHLLLDGSDVEEVLARLMPLDLSLKAAPIGSALRSQLGHMSVLLLRTGDTCFELLVFRSMADTAVHDLTRAMRAVAARRAI